MQIKKGIYSLNNEYNSIISSKANGPFYVKTCDDRMHLV